MFYITRVNEMISNEFRLFSSYQKTLQWITIKLIKKTSIFSFIAASLYCRCTKEHCDHVKLPTCYTVNSCFTKTMKGNISAGCVHSSNFEVWLCDLKHASTTYNCCKTDNCNDVGLSPLHYLPGKQSKIKIQVKILQRTRRTGVYLRKGQRSEISLMELQPILNFPFIYTTIKIVENYM